MLKPVCVYVPSNSKENFEIGVARQIWGWRPSALDRAGARATVQNMEEGDYLLLGHRGPNSRVAPGGWSDATIQRLIVARITKPWFVDTAEVWPDDEYPERVLLEVLDTMDGVHGSQLSPAVMEAFRLSANKQGVPVFGGTTQDLMNLADQVHDPAADEEPEGVQDGPSGGLVDVEGSTDVVRAVYVRKEQRKIRKELFGKKAAETCRLCGRELPVRLLVAAHIKRRAEATPDERLMLANMMPVCLLGCDALFEYGHIYVDKNGIVRSAANDGLAALASAAAELDGRACESFNGESSPFFAHHRAKAVAV